MRALPLFLACLVAGCGGEGVNPMAHPDMTPPPPPDMATLDPGPISVAPQISNSESETHVAVGANGYVAVAYIAIKINGSTNGYRFSTDNGDTFLPPTKIDSPMGRETSDPVLAVDGKDNFYLTWVEFIRQNNGGVADMHVYAARALAGTTNFTDAIEVTDNPNGSDQYDKPWITVTNDGAVLVTYARTSSGGIFAARSTDWKTFTSATIVEDGGFRNLVFPCQPSTGNRLYATYHAGGGIGLHWSDDGGVTWPAADKAAVADPNDTRPAFDDPTCAADGNEVWVSYGLSNDQFSTTVSAKLYSVKVAHSSDGGMTIDRRAEAGDSAAGSLYIHPYLLREPNGALDLLYYAGNSEGDTAASLRHGRSLDGGMTWPASAAVKNKLIFTGRRDTGQWLGDYVGAAWSAGELYTSYADNSGQVVHVAFYRTAEPGL